MNYGVSSSTMSSSFPRKWESRLSKISLVESLDSRVRGNDGRLGYDKVR